MLAEFRPAGRLGPWKRLAACTAIVVLTAGLPTIAKAQAGPPPVDSAVDQYTELVPTGTGGKAPGIGRERRSSLSPKAKKALEAAPKQTAESLAEVATSSNYGAPPSIRPARKTRQKQFERPSPTDKLALDRTVSAAAAAAAPVDDQRMVGLLVAMVATAVVGGALAIRNRRM